ncbi:hypothetical protein ACE193_14415 [Bernardetia sp. OM2101]|uniref:hypothetical protein n=1 Tax=Bernardetia sp. OM2101 TaxID=3344876 RepID=UPI0035CFDDB1
MLNQTIVYIIFIAFLFVTQFSFGQVTNNEKSLLKELKVKTRKTVYYKSEDTTQSKPKLYLKSDYHEDRRLKEHYFYVFFDVVKYSRTTNYKYDDDKNLIESTTWQKIFNEGDNEYLAMFGDDPIHERRLYTYNKKGKLIKKREYTFGEKEFDESKPNQTITYTYEKGTLKEEEGNSHRRNSKLGASSQDYITTYSYDKKKNLIQKKTVFITLPNKPETIIDYSYDKKGSLVEEKAQSTSYGNRENYHKKYEYNKKGQKIKELVYNSQSKEWEEEIFEYNDAGNIIPKNTESDTYYFYPNGLIKGYIWKSGNEVLHFVDEYEFY